MPIFSLTPKQEAIRDQLAGAQKHHLVYGGSRSGKTFLIAYAIHMRALMAPGSRHAIFRRHGVAVKQSIGKDTFPKMVKLATPEVDLRWHEQDGYFSYPNGSEVWLAGLDDKDRVDKILGKEFASLYFNEASEIPLSSYTVAQTRLAQNVMKTNGQRLALRDYVDLNPTTRAHWTYRMWIDGIHPDGEAPIDRSNYAMGVANPTDNADNLPPDYITSLMQLPERQRRRFFSGEFTADVENALWRREWIRRTQDAPKDLARVVIAIDPAVSNDVGSDETGIIAAGIDAGGNAYVLEDASGRYRPEEWARKAIGLYHAWDADRIVAEVNQGGQMVEALLRAQRANVPYRAVHATRGKVTRAEPVAALYEQNKVYHAGEFSDLESQMCSFTTGFDRKAQGYSPDRVDALVWALTDLFPRMTRRATTTPTAPTAVNQGAGGWMRA
jgi:predicted phage terminase large subunit-like protein